MDPGSADGDLLGLSHRRRIVVGAINPNHTKRETAAEQVQEDILGVRVTLSTMAGNGMVGVNDRRRWR